MFQFQFYLEFKIQKLLKLLEPSKSSELWKNWTTLAREMEMSVATTGQLRTSLQIGTWKFDDVMENILIEWKSKKSNDATMGELLKILKACGLNKTYGTLTFGMNDLHV